MKGAPWTEAHPDDATLGAYHDGEVRGFALGEVEEHLTACPRCRKSVQAIDHLDEALRALPQLEPSAALSSAVRDRVRDHSKARPAIRPLWGVVAVLAALATLIGGYDALAPHGVMSSQQVASAPAARDPADNRVTPPNVIQGQRASARSASGPGAPASGAARLAISAPRAAQGNRVGQTSPLSHATARLITRTGTVNVRVPDVQQAFDAVSKIASDTGGYVASSDNNASTTSNGARGATLTLRVPADHFGTAMIRIAALPHDALTARSGSSDISDDYHDLQAQAQALRVTRDQLTTLMRRARSTNDAMTILDRLTMVNTDLDRVLGQIQSDDNSVALSTITVHLAPEPARRHVVPAPRHKESGPAGWQPGRTLAAALVNLGLALQAIITVAIYAGVYVTLPGALLLTVLLWRRMRRPPARWRLPRNA